MLSRETRDVCSEPGFSFRQRAHRDYRIASLFLSFSLSLFPSLSLSLSLSPSLYQDIHRWGGRERREHGQEENYTPRAYREPHRSRSTRPKENDARPSTPNTAPLLEFMATSAPSRPTPPPPAPLSLPPRSPLPRSPFIHLPPPPCSPPSRSLLPCPAHYQPARRLRLHRRCHDGLSRVASRAHTQLVMNPPSLGGHLPQSHHHIQHRGWAHHRDQPLITPSLRLASEPRTPPYVTTSLNKPSQCHNFIVSDLAATNLCSKRILICI